MIVKSIADDTFGRLDWDPLLECWLGGIDWPPGLHTEVAIRPSDRGLAASLRRARENLDWLQGHQEHARLSVAQAALTFYNDA